MIFFFDRNAGKVLPATLRSMGFPVECYHDHFSDHRIVPDTEWLEYVGERGWFVVSHDRKLHKRPLELQKLMEHRIGCFYLRPANGTTAEKVELFVRAYGRIFAAAYSTLRPFIFEVQKTGKLRRRDIGAAADIAALP